MESIPLSPGDLTGPPLPGSYRAPTLHLDEVPVFEGLDGADKDPGDTHIDAVNRFRTAG